MNRNRFLMILAPIVLTAIVGGAVKAKAFGTQTSQDSPSIRPQQDRGDFVGKYPMQLIIKTPQGEVISVLEIPAGVRFEISASEEIRGPWKKGYKALCVFTGDISIRAQMAGSPLKLDVQNALIEIQAKR
jgi:hypothetical protein